MKNSAIICIKLYQLFLSPLLKQLTGSRPVCRFNPSCSQYALLSIEKHGLIKGINLSVKRLISCQPFNYKYANI